VAWRRRGRRSKKQPRPQPQPRKHYSGGGPPSAAASGRLEAAVAPPGRRGRRGASRGGALEELLEIFEGQALVAAFHVSWLAKVNTNLHIIAAHLARQPAHNEPARKPVQAEREARDAQRLRDCLETRDCEVLEVGGGSAWRRGADRRRCVPSSRKYSRSSSAMIYSRTELNLASAPTTHKPTQELYSLRASLLDLPAPPAASGGALLTQQGRPLEAAAAATAAAAAAAADHDHALALLTGPVYQIDPKDGSEIFIARSSRSAQYPVFIKRRPAAGDGNGGGGGDGSGVGDSSGGGGRGASSGSGASGGSLYEMPSWLARCEGDGTDEISSFLAVGDSSSSAAGAAGSGRERAAGGWRGALERLRQQQQAQWLWSLNGKQWATSADFESVRRMRMHAAVPRCQPCIVCVGAPDIKTSYTPIHSNLLKSTDEDQRDQPCNGDPPDAP
jgi:hypothetical protein